MKNKIASVIHWSVLLFISFLIFQGCEKKTYDVVILNGTIYDGTGNPGKKADLGIKDGEITAIGTLKDAKAAEIIDASDLAVSPGFIDLHAHIESLPSNPNALSKLHQGVTTTLGGPDGFSPFPLRSYTDSLRSLPLGINVAYLVGHNTVRKLVMDLDNRNPTPDELEEMKSKVEQAMAEGAFGISTGLKYLPGTFSEVDEVIELAKSAAQNGGFYTSHLREEGLGLLEGVREAIEIGHQANIPIVLTHHKVVGKPSWGNSQITLRMVDSAIAAGQDVQLDQYPYTASFTSISILIPSWSMAGGNTEFKKRIKDPGLRKKIKEEIVFNILNDRGGGDIKNVQFSQVTWDEDLENKTLADWAVMKGLEPTPETGADLIIEAQSRGGAKTIFHAMDEADVQRIMKHPRTMIASDGRLSELDEGHPHPRVYGTFPRVLGKYVRDEKIISLEEGIKKMTYLPAQRMGLTDRGIIKAGKKADLVIFDPEAIADKATFSDPHQYPEGIYYVFVNGVKTIEKGESTGNFAGEILLKNNKKTSQPN